MCPLIGGTYPQPSRQPYLPSNMCERAPTDGFAHVTERPVNLIPAYLVDFIVSRLLRPISRNSRHGTEKADTSREQLKKPELKPEKRREWVERIQRPTTASTYRKCCALAGDPVLRKYQHVRFSPRVSVNTVRLDEILERVRASTVSSRKNRGQCKRSDCDANGDKQKIGLALMSGLSPSHCVNDIVERLYRPVVTPTTRSKM